MCMSFNATILLLEADFFVVSRVQGCRVSVFWASDLKLIKGSKKLVSPDSVQPQGEDPEWAEPGRPGQHCGCPGRAFRRPLRFRTGFCEDV